MLLAKHRNASASNPAMLEMLQAQAEVLTTRFGISSQVSTVLRQLWLSHLPSTGMLEPTPHQPPAAALSAATGQPGAAAGVVGAATHGVGAAADGADGSTPDALEQQQQLQQRSTVLVMPKNMKQLFWKVCLGCVDVVYVEHGWQQDVFT